MGMRVEFAPHLLEAVVRRCVDLNVGGTIAAEYRRLYDRLADAGLHRDPGRLLGLNYHLFRARGLESLFQEAAAEFPSLPGPMRVGPADRLEGCFLPEERTAVIVRLRPDRFEAPAALRRFLRHELAHVADMLDARFRHPPRPPSLDPSVQDRLALLWGARTDARLVRRGLEPLRDREEWAGLFDRHWIHIEPAVRRAAFERFWDASDRLGYPGLLKLASSQAAFPRRYGGSAPAGGAGSRCPLCRFPTFAWVGNGRLAPAVAAAIRKDFPAWKKAQGACERCVELYEIRAN